ncbi:MAG: hypothetical protein NT105_03335 [Verrucomicrobia bacterium]|nr:hypothetical protein [Verrucomicrobiota bacterium]
MPVMKSIDGRLYNMPDENAAKFLIPMDKVAETLKEAGLQAPEGAGPSGQVQAYGGHGGHGGHHGGGGWWGFGAGLALGAAAASSYNNYSNYRNYSNYYGW